MLGKNAIRKISIVVNGQIFKNNLEPSGHIALNVYRKLFCLPGIEPNRITPMAVPSKCVLGRSDISLLQCQLFTFLKGIESVVYT